MLLSLLSRRSLEVDSRDAYGFVLRPQHVQRYREYAEIYKEEEEERSSRWKFFLERTKSGKRQSIAEEVAELFPAEITKTLDSERGGEGYNSSEKSKSDGLAERDPEEQLQLSQESEESDCLTKRNPAEQLQLSEESDSSTKSDPEEQVQLSEESEESDTLTKRDPEEQVQLSEEPEEEVEYSEELEKAEEQSEEPEKEARASNKPKKELQHSKEHKSEEQHFKGHKVNQLLEEPEKEEELSIEPEREKLPEQPKKEQCFKAYECGPLSEEPEKEDQLSKEPEKEQRFKGYKSGQLSEEPEEEEQLSIEPEKEQYFQGYKNKQLSKALEEEELHCEEQGRKEKLPKEPENEEQQYKHKKREQLSKEAEKQESLLKETKVSNAQTWSAIRPSLRALNIMMSLRVKSKMEAKDKQNSTKRDHLPSTKESPKIGYKGAAGKEIRVNGALDECSNEHRAESIMDDTSPEPFFPCKEELEFLVRGGVPRDLRGEVWQAFIGVKVRRVERYYEKLLDQDQKTDEDVGHSAEAFRKWRKQIEKDIPRTFPGHPALNEHGRDSLRRLLLAYARHNPSVGYCQAMNFFAGLLLLLMPEENAFWALVGIIDDYFEGYYTEEMIESQVDQLVFEELMRERFPKLVNHLDYLEVQVAWISGPWFLSIFINMLPWESVLRVWDVLLFEGNRVMLFRTALALMDLYGPALVTTKDAGDAITLLQSLAGSTFDSSQLVLTACMGFLAITEGRLQQLREKHRPSVLEVVEERSRRGKIWNDSKGLASKLYSFKHEPEALVEEKRSGDKVKSQLKPRSSNLDDLLNGIDIDSELDSLPDLQEKVVWLKVELCRLLQEKRSAILRSEELETALMEMVRQDNRRQLSAKVEQLEQDIADLQQALSDKKEQEAAMLKVLMRVEQEQRITEEARLSAEQDAAAQRHATNVLQEKYEKATASLAQMEKRVVMAESMLEATLQYERGQAKALSSPRAGHSPVVESPRRRISLFGWRDRKKGILSSEELGEKMVSNEDTLQKESSNLENNT